MYNVVCYKSVSFVGGPYFLGLTIRKEHLAVAREWLSDLREIKLFQSIVYLNIAVIKKFGKFFLDVWDGHFMYLGVNKQYKIH
jgi:hypothetical protein